LKVAMPPRVGWVTVPPRIGVPLLLCSLRDTVIEAAPEVDWTWKGWRTCPEVVSPSGLRKFSVSSSRASRVSKLGRKREGVRRPRGVRGFVRQEKRGNFIAASVGRWPDDGRG
jgi:hypothetical protein